MTNFAGIRVSDTLAALLDQAAASGFRIEADTRGKGRPSGLIAYPPDKTKQPVTISERGKSTPHHYANIKNDLVRAGMPDLPALAAQPEAKLPPMPPPVAVNVRVETADELDAQLRSPQAQEVALGIVDSLAQRMGMTEYEAALASGVFGLVASWVKAGTDLTAKDVEVARLEQRRADLAEIEASLTLAQECEARADAADKRAEKAAAVGAETGRLLTAAIARAEAAEAKARELEAAIAPMRALFASPAQS